MANGNDTDQGENTAQPSPDSFEGAQWKPGQSGNPAGRPKGIADVRLIRAELTDELLREAPRTILGAIEATGQKVGSRTVARAIARAASEKAMKGDVPAMRYVSEQTEDARPRGIEVTGKDGGPIEVNDARSKLRELVEKRKAGDGSDEGGG